MEILFREFRIAQVKGSGPLLATTLIPAAPSDDPNRLQKIYRGSDRFSIASDIRSGLLAHLNTDLRWPKAEGTAWVDLYVAFWKAIAEIVEVENSAKDASWVKAYDAWKEVAVVLIRGYTTGYFQAWTVPCLYVAGQYLRIFAIKADESVRGSQNAGFGASGFQEDIVGNFGNNERLEDAARMLNRIFTMCISDRYVERMSLFLLCRLGST